MRRREFGKDRGHSTTPKTVKPAASTCMCQSDSVRAHVLEHLGSSVKLF